jgi:hypothetical protein
MTGCAAGLDTDWPIASLSKVTGSTFLGVERLLMGLV